MTKWYYSKEGQTCGPATVDEIRELVARGLLGAGDRIWQEGSDPKLEARAETILDLSNPTQVQPSVPDWLEDVSGLETRGPVPPPPASHELPDWLEDLQAWYGLGASPAPPVSPPIPPEAAAPTVPPPDGAQKDVPPPPQKGTPSDNAGQEGVQAGADLQAELAVRETGYDSRTGRILDPERFRAWQRSQAAPAARTGPLTNVSLMQAFHTARSAINRWVDDGDHRFLVLHGKLDEMEDSAGVTAVLKQYADYGPLMREKLLKHLAFMVENRREYYAVIGPTGS